MTRGFPQVGDILFTTEAPLGNAALVDIALPFALAQRTICFSRYSDLHTPYLVNVLLSPWFADELSDLRFPSRRLSMETPHAMRQASAAPRILPDTERGQRGSEASRLRDYGRASAAGGSFKQITAESEMRLSTTFSPSPFSWSP
jgi:hypothetical protein